MLFRSLCLCTVLLSLTGVCIAGGNVGLFPSPDSPEEQRLATAISSGDLSVVKSAAKEVDLRHAYALKNYILRNGTGEIVRYINSLAELDVTPLQIAVIANDLKAVESLFPRLSQRPPAAYRSDHHSPLRLAIRKQNVPMVKLLIQQNMPVNESVLTFRPPEKISIVLSAAIHEGNAEIVRLLVDAGALLEQRQTYLVPVPGATHNGQPVRQLLGDLTMQSLSYTADHKRIASEKKKLLQELRAKGLMKRQDVPDANKNCPLADAIFAGRKSVVAVLLEGGADADVSIGGTTRPLHIAIRTGHPGIVKLLIDAGAEVNRPDSQGRSPLGLAFYKGDIADMLRAAGAKLRLDPEVEFVPR